jgi:arylsulfatase
MNSDKPNIILIVVDALRADHLSCYGYHRRTSPNLDRLAEESVLFESAFAASPSTVGSIPSILSGLYPSLHGTGVDGNVLNLNKAISMLPEVLKKAGYTTVGFNTNPYMASKHGYDKGYVSYFDLFPSQRKTFSKRKICSKEVNKEIAKWLEDCGQQPFFMWVHYLDSHGPFFPREPYFSQYSSTKPQEQVIDFKENLEQIYTRFTKEPDLKDTQKRELLVNCYDSEIAYFDENFAGLVDSLRRCGLFDNTMLIVTADHGEGFWEHGVWGHPMTMYDVNIHVPLLIRYLPFGCIGKTISKQVRNIDIFPTVLDILNMPPDRYVSGVSLLPYVEDESSAPEVAVVSEGGGIKGISVDFYIDRVYSLRTPTCKYVKNVTQNQKQLFQLQDDPLELKNLAYEPYVQDIVEDLDLKLADLLKPTTELKSDASPTQLDGQIRQQLEALGYM